jgi:hypothetical protein
MRPKRRPLRHPALLGAASLGRTIGPPPASSLPSAPRIGATQPATAVLTLGPPLRGRRQADDVIAPAAPTDEACPAPMSWERPPHGSSALRRARSWARPAWSRRPFRSATCFPREAPPPRCLARSPQPVPQQPSREPHGRSRRQSRQPVQRPARQQAPATQPQAQRPPRWAAARQTRYAEATGSKDRRSPADRSSRACRSTRTGRAGRRRRSDRLSRPPTLLPRARRAPLRSTRGGRAWPCIQTTSGSTPSSHPSEPFRRTTPHPLRERAQGCRSARRGRHLGAGRPRKGASGRSGRGAAPGRRRATSRPAHSRREAHTRKRSGLQVAALFPPCCQF